LSLPLSKYSLANLSGTTVTKKKKFYDINAWPLDEGSKVKDKFDEIFSSAKYKGNYTFDYVST